MTTGSAQQHDIGLYLRVWALVIGLMLIKATLIVAVFMHMAWERLALICAILIPPLSLAVLVALMAIEAHYTFQARTFFFN
jgi:cytochrome c oxidase subunit 4